MERDGGADQLPPELASLLTGEALRKVTLLQQDAKKQGMHWDGKPRFQMYRVAQLMTYVPVGTTIALQACEGISGATMLDGYGDQRMPATPTMLLYRYYMRHNDQDQLIIYNINGGTEAIASCPF